MSITERYPSWVHNLLINNNLLWEKGLKSTFQEFGKTFTLHDSHWVELHYNVAYDDTAILVIDWDNVWLPNYLKQQLNPDVSLILLFIKLYQVKQISTSGYHQWKESYPIHRGISDYEIQIIDQHSLLVISDFYGGCVEIIFSGSTSFLSVTQEQHVLNLIE